MNLVKKLQSISLIFSICFISLSSSQQAWNTNFNTQQNSLSVQPLQSQNAQPQSNSVAESDPAVQVAIGQEKFALGLYLECAQFLNTKNFVISPFSIWSLLVLVAEGASGNTYKEMIKTLGLPDNIAYVAGPYRQIQNYLKINTSSAEIYTSQSLILDRKLMIKPRFAERVTRDYRSDLLMVNFDDSTRALNEIEAYMRKVSNGRIGNILTVEDVRNAQMIMLSSILFDARWELPFNKSNTKKESFYNEQGAVLGDVQMMFQQGAFPFTAMAELESHLLELPYGDKELSMIMILPRKGVSLASVIGKLQSVSLAQMFAELHKAAQEFEEDEVEVHIPRFSVQSDITLAYFLENMGILDLFDQQRARLDEISTNPTFLSQVIHKVEIRVNEEGTFAAATTAGVFSNKATPPRFYANRPFLYIIVEKQSNTVLFLGQIYEPEGFRA